MALGEQPEQIAEAPVSVRKEEPGEPFELDRAARAARQTEAAGLVLLKHGYPHQGPYYRKWQGLLY